MTAWYGIYLLTTKPRQSINLKTEAAGAIGYSLLCSRQNNRRRRRIFSLSVAIQRVCHLGMWISYGFEALWTEAGGTRRGRLAPRRKSIRFIYSLAAARASAVKSLIKSITSSGFDILPGPVAATPFSSSSASAAAAADRLAQRHGARIRAKTQITKITKRDIRWFITRRRTTTATSRGQIMRKAQIRCTEEIIEKRLGHIGICKPEIIFRKPLMLYLGSIEWIVGTKVKVFGDATFQLLNWPLEYGKVKFKSSKRKPKCDFLIVGYSSVCPVYHRLGDIYSRIVHDHDLEL